MNDIQRSSNPLKFRRAQWRMLFALMFSYLFYYTARQNWGWVVTGLHDDLGFSLVETGTIAGAMLAAYGVGQFVNGGFGDAVGARKMMSLGAIVSTILSWITSFGYSFQNILIPWAANGYFQSFGWAPGCRLITNWWGEKERGKAYGLYLLAAGFSSVLTFGLCILTLQHLGWRWIFRLPPLLLFASGILFYIIVRDRPEDLHFHSEDEPSRPVGMMTLPGESAIHRYTAVLGNPRFLFLSLAMGCMSMARYGLLTWVPFYYLGNNWKQQPAGIYITLILPLGMAIGALTGGYLSDKLFRGKRQMVVVLLAFSAAIVCALMAFIPPGRILPAVGGLLLAGFFVYGPHSSLWALCPDTVGKHRTATASGIMDACAYAFAAVQGPLYGWTIQTYGGRTIFLLTSAISLLCILFVATASVIPVRRQKESELPCLEVEPA